ncbi:polysaccharide lyase family 8 super-sandwich domain-containing protein [Flexithrix dorotheae]|uniref:polysaccharide lyase family 8 super-sandwich domain-containing protein n=1 Tax=Flexithrix dorotheae TaxID=70993 RepID=UPI000364437F|nr:polysaccharide lyase family 8 super-sandwich domain-containing protein [Flexithrix dorotheae]
MKKELILVNLVLMLFTISAYPKPDLEIVRQRVIEVAMDAGVKDEIIKQRLNDITSDGSWDYINYEDVSRTGFENRNHLSNMVLMARAYKSKKSSYYKSKKLKAAIESALNFWVKKDFICDNWWHNQIGTPTNLVTLLLIMDGDLPGDLVEKTQPIIGRAHLNASGARPSGDRIKIAGILAKNLLYNKDGDGFDEVIEVIEGEIKFATGRGMQYDYSFHHRKDRVNNTLSYGLGYAYAFAEWAAYVAGTKYAFSNEKINQLTDYYLDGICKHMVYAKFPDPAAKNRSITREGTLKPQNASTAIKLLKASTYRKNEIEEIIAICLEGEKATTSHATFFWQSEHFTFQRPDFFTSVRMYSTRNNNMEVPYNGEGLYNHYRGDGVNHISITGRELYDIWPVYDWQKIPGATILQKPSLIPEEGIQKDGLTDFVGAITNGNYGAAAFDFISPHDLVKARKSWFFFDDIYVCLGAGISSRSEYPVATTLNQCLLNGEVSVWENGEKKLLEKGERELKEVTKIYHDGVGYIFPEPTIVNLQNDQVSGSWFKINRQSDSPKEEVKLDAFKLWLDHGSHPNESAYEYYVVPATSAEGMENHPENRVEVLENSKNLQAVTHKGLNLYQIVFYKSGEIQLNDDLILSAESPGLVMIRTDGNEVKEISVSDPGRKLSNLYFSITSKLKSGAENIQIRWNEKSGKSEISVLLPEGVMAGKSMTFLF